MENIIPILKAKWHGEQFKIDIITYEIKKGEYYKIYNYLY